MKGDWESVRQNLYSNDENLITSALYACKNFISEINKDDAVLDMLSRLIHDDDENIRERAVFITGVYLKSTRFLGDLLNLLEGESSDFVLGAIFASLSALARNDLKVKFFIGRILLDFIEKRSDLITRVAYANILTIFDLTNPNEFSRVFDGFVVINNENLLLIKKELAKNI